MSYQKLQAKYQEIGDLEHALAMLGWDEAVMMPSGAEMTRANSLATLAAHVHRLKSSPDNKAWLGEASGDNSLNKWQRANLDQMQRDWVIARAVLEDLVVALSKASSNCEQNWRNHRAENDWKVIEPLLREVLSLTQKKANCLSEARDTSHHPCYGGVPDDTRITTRYNEDSIQCRKLACT